MMLYGQAVAPLLLSEYNAEAHATGPTITTSACHIERMDGGSVDGEWRLTLFKNISFSFAIHSPYRTRIPKYFFSTFLFIPLTEHTFKKKYFFLPTKLNRVQGSH